MSAAEHATDHWDHKDQWRKHGKNFLIVVERFNGRADADDGTGPNRWAVYAYIYPKHPHFAAFEGPRMWQEAATCLSGELLICRDEAAFYVDSVCFERHGHTKAPHQWVASASIWALAEDLGLARVRTNPSRPFAVDDFGNLRLAGLEQGERQWVYPEEWQPEEDEDEE